MLLNIIIRLSPSKDADFIYIMAYFIWRHQKRWILIDATTLKLFTSTWIQAYFIWRHQNVDGYINRCLHYKVTVVNVFINPGIFYKTPWKTDRIDASTLKLITSIRMTSGKCYLTSSNTLWNINLFNDCALNLYIFKS